MMQIRSEIHFDEFDEACEKAGMHRTKAHHDNTDVERRYCRSDEWQGDLLIFALSVLEIAEKRKK